MSVEISRPCELTDVHEVAREFTFNWGRPFVDEDLFEWPKGSVGSPFYG